MSYVDGGISCNNLPQNIFTVSWSQKLNGLLGRLTPQFSTPLPILKAQDHKEALFPPLERDAFSSTHEFIQLLRRRRTHHHHIQPNREREPRRGRKENRKGINHIHLVSVHSIQHTFWPSCGVKRNGLRWRGQDVTSRQIWTFVVDEGEQCERRRWR